MHNNQESGYISRREFFGSVIKIGTSAIIATTLLSGCSSEGDSNVNDETISRGPAWSEYNLETYCEGYKEDKEAGTLENEYIAVKDGEIYRLYYHKGRYYAVFEGYESE